MGSKNKREKLDVPKTAADDNGKFAIIEGYKIARTNLMFSLAASESKFVAFTSWSKGEGKSTSTTNMAISLSKMGKKVLLIDADLRKSNIHNLLNLPNEKGFSEVLGKFENFDDVVQKDVLPCLDVVTSGAIPPNPSELLGSPQLKKNFEIIDGIYDYVLVDTPPLGLVTDALMIKDQIAGYVVIVRERRTKHGEIEKIMQMIKLADSHILGFLKVGCKGHESKKGMKGEYYYYYYK